MLAYLMKKERERDELTATHSQSTPNLHEMDTATTTSTPPASAVPARMLPGGAGSSKNRTNARETSGSGPIRNAELRSSFTVDMLRDQAGLIIAHMSIYGNNH
jgi:hypothetical protein